MGLISEETSENYMILDNRDRIKHISMSAYDYLDDYNKFYLGYPRDRINKDDTIIIIEKNYYLNKELYNNKFLNKLGVGNKLSNAENFLLITSYANKDTQSIFKKNVEDLKINTIYRGHEIDISIDENQLVNLKIDEKKYYIKQSCFRNQIIIINESIIKYYISEDIENIKDLKDVFEKEFIPSNFKINKQKILNKNYCKIFDNNFIDALKSIENNNLKEKLFKQGESIILLKKEKITIDKIEYRLISFYSKKITTDIIEKNKKIIELIEKYKNNKVKVYNYKYKNIIGNSSKIKHVKYLLNKASKTNATIMLLGESGTGKSLIAEEIHKDSKRQGDKFINLNCAAIPVNLIESELFGYEEGSFTGAKKGGKRGYFEIANGGTIFLDEIGEIPLEIQGRLLEVLQNQTFYRVGGDEKLKVDVRVVAATNKNLEELVEKNKFRKDLFYRLNVFPIEIPPLRERSEDIEILCKFLLPKICNRLDIEPLLISKETIDSLKEYSWPGNIRELENTLEQSSIMCEGKIIKPENILINKKEERKIVTERSLKKQREELEKRIIMETLSKTNNNKTETAEILDIGRTTLFEKMKKYNIKM